jgi:predicted membrane channel-forming protein YqfA (hemolysin III family)
MLHYMAVSLAIVFYLVGAIIFTLQIPSQYKSLTEYYSGYSDTFSTVHQLVLFTEVKA